MMTIMLAATAVATNVVAELAPVTVYASRIGDTESDMPAMVQVFNADDIAGSGACKLIGPCGEVELSEGVIAAQRHIHLTPETAAEFGVKDKQIVKVKVNGLRPLIFDAVVVRVSPKFSPAMHIDTDESNAAFGATEGEIIVD